MRLSEHIRNIIANRMIQIVAPITIGGMILVTLGLLIFGDKQFHRLVPASVAMAALIPAWFRYQKAAQ